MTLPTPTSPATRAHRAPSSPGGSAAFAEGPHARRAALVAAPGGLDAGIDWDALRPRGAYARAGQPLLNLALLFASLPPAIALGALVALVNTFVHRDPRRIFFIQPRVGQRGRIFPLLKFRTMRDAPLPSFASWGQGDAARVTTFGRFLRNTHLDELPQILNVLLGDMNFIGPRPEMLEIERWASEHVSGFTERLRIKPGLTGLAQISQGYVGYDVEGYAEKLRWNELYVRRMSLALDLRILARTAAWMLCGRGWRWDRVSERSQRP